MSNDRLVPRRGAGPDLRKGGRQIDEYLMRLLRFGSSANPAESTLPQSKVRPGSFTAMMMQCPCAQGSGHILLS